MIISYFKIIIITVKLFIIIFLLSIDNDFFKFLPIILSLILSIAFLTLLERKVLAGMQRRRGPMWLVFMVYYKLSQMGLN